MKNSDAPATGSALGRRDFMKIGVGGAVLAALPAGAGGGDKRERRGLVGRETRAKAASENLSRLTATRTGRPSRTTKRWPTSGSRSPIPIRSTTISKSGIQWMDEHGVLMHCLTLSGSMPWQWTSAEQGAHLAQIINDTGIEVHKKHPDRFVLGIEIPIRDPQLALKELNRVAGKPGVRAVHLAGLDGAARLHHRTELCAGPRAHRGIGPADYFSSDGRSGQQLRRRPGFRAAESGGRPRRAHRPHRAGNQVNDVRVYWTNIRSWKWCCRTRAAPSRISREGSNISSRISPIRIFRWRARSGNICGGSITTI